LLAKVASDADDDVPAIADMLVAYDAELEAATTLAEAAETAASVFKVAAALEAGAELAVAVADELTVSDAAVEAAVSATPDSAADTGCVLSRMLPPPRTVAATNNEAKIHFLPSLYIMKRVFFALRLRFMLINFIKLHAPLPLIASRVSCQPSID
jgi:hypothetical protein